MKKSFCLFCANYLPNLGGVERYVYNLAKALIKHGNSVTVVTSNVFDLPEYEVSKEGIEIFRLPCYNVMKGRYPILRRNNAFKKLDKALSERKFDLVVINARFYIHSIYAAKFAKRNNVKCITVEHGSSHLSVNNRILDLFGAVYEHLITSVLKKYCYEFYGVSKATCDWSGHFGIKSKGVLYNAIDIELVNKMLQKSPDDYREKINISDSAIIITFIGRVLKIKGVYELLEAFKRLKLNDACLIFAGDGNELVKLKSISCNADNIKFLGQIDFESIIALLKATDIFCLPSVSEGMPTSVLEAVATETFVITTDVGGAKELILSDDYGIIMNNNSVENIMEAIKKSLDSEYRERAVENAYKALLENFTWDKTAEKFEEIVD